MKAKTGMRALPVFNNDVDELSGASVAIMTDKSGKSRIDVMAGAVSFCCLKNG